MNKNTLIGAVVIIIVVASAAAYYMMQPREPETPTHTLNVGSSPVSGIAFTLDGQNFETPHSEELEEDSYTISIGAWTAVGGKNYVFTGWEDGVISSERSVDLSSDLALMANYEEIIDEEPEPEPEGSAIISGVVTDADTDDPLEGVTIEVNGESAMTSSDGTYSLNVTLGSYDMTVNLDGYEADESSVDATEEKTYTLDFSLVPSSITLQVITRHGSDITMKAEQMFMQSEYAEKYNIKDIKWLGVSSALWAETIRRKGDIDLGWGGGPVVFDIVYNEGLTAPLMSDEVQEYLDQIPDMLSGVPAKRIDDGEVHWVGAAISSFGFTINTQVLELEGLPQPTKWTDLANETYAVTLPSPVIGTADATLSTSNTRIFEIIIQTFGWEEGWKILTLIGANSRIYDKSELVRDGAIIGEIGAGTTIDFYGYTAQLQNPGVCWYVFPEDGTLLNADPIALLNTSPHPQAAQAFVAWLLSPEGQIPWLDPNINRLPMNPAVFDTPEGQERSDLEEIYYMSQDAVIIEFSDELALSYEFPMMFFFRSTLVRAQGKLVDAWIDITRAKADGDITQAQFVDLVDQLSNPLIFEFTDPDTGETETFTQEYAQSVAELMMADITFKTNLEDEWLEKAEARYDSVMAQVAALIP
ncbi:MAG: extracellular solute-binding protein [Candidatus Bathyarchaeota archaeon]|nr:extracellular solute-binding protein [Candidatus Bathyarchaeota archaeon]